VRWARLLTGFVAVLLDAVLAPRAFAEEIEVRAELERQETFLGEAVTLRIVIDGVARAKGPDPAAFGPDFHAGAPEFRPRSSTLTTFVNGVESQRRIVGCSFHYTLRPLRAGVLTVPALDVVAGGETLRTQPLALRVVGPSPSAVAELEFALSRERVVVEEPVFFELIVRVQALELDGQPMDADPWLPREPLELRIPWFQELEGFTADDFIEWAQPLVGDQGFSVNGMTTRDFFNDRVVQFAFPAETVTRDGTRWREYRLRREFRPLTAGARTIPVSTLRGRVVTRVERRGRSSVVTDSVGVFVSHDPVALTVEPVPDTGRPATYRHAVGRYRVEAGVEPRRAKVGDPMKLTVRVWGEGLVDRVLPPLLSAQADLARDFAVGESAAAPEIDGTTKVFTFTIRPRSAEVEEVPPIEFAFFDPAEHRFAVALSKATPVEVEEATEVGADDLVGGAGRVDHSSSPGEELTGGLLANDGFAEMLADESYAPTTSVVFWLILFGSPLAYGGLAAVALRRRKLSSDPLRVRAEGALAEARAALSDSRSRLSAGDTGGAAEALHHALAGFVAARARLPAGGMTAADLRELFERRAIDTQAARALTDTAALCERVRFGGGGAEELSAALDRADGWLVSLRKEPLA